MQISVNHVIQYTNKPKSQRKKTWHRWDSNPAPFPVREEAGKGAGFESRGAKFFSLISWFLCVLYHVVNTNPRFFFQFQRDFHVFYDYLHTEEAWVRIPAVPNFFL
jgi:hypothetical protein